MRRRKPATRLLALALPLLLAGGSAAGGPEGKALPIGADGDPPDRVAQVPQAAERTDGPDGDPEEGRRLFSRIGCNGCHMVDEVGGMVGPDLTEVGARPSPDPDRWPTTEAYIHSSIRDPGAYIVDGYTDMMPRPEVLGLDDEMIDHLVAYLLGLRGGSE